MQIMEIVEMVEDRPVVEIAQEDFQVIYDSVNKMSMEELNLLDDKLAIGADIETEIDSEYGKYSAILATIMTVYQRKAQLIVEEIKRPGSDPFQIEELIKSSYRRMWLLTDLAHHLKNEIQEDEERGEEFNVNLHGIAGFVYATLAFGRWLR